MGEKALLKHFGRLYKDFRGRRREDVKGVKIGHFWSKIDFSEIDLGRRSEGPGVRKLHFYADLRRLRPLLRPFLA